MQDQKQCELHSKCTSTSEEHAWQELLTAAVPTLQYAWPEIANMSTWLPAQPWTSEQIEEELKFLVRAVAQTDLDYDDWYVLLERTQLHADMRAATKGQWERFSRYCTIMESRLDRLRSG